jgi:hydroxypyruvate isomerase
MPQLAANLSMMFNEVPFLDRFEAAARAGFTAVEYLFPYEYPAAELRRRLDGAGLRQVLFNMAPGDWAAGERGLASLPGRTMPRPSIAGWCIAWRGFRPRARTR